MAKTPKADRNQKIWAFSGSGTKAHAFIQLTDSVMRAMCRESIKALTSGSFFSQKAVKPESLCGNCLNRAEAMWDRLDESMAPDPVHNPQAHADFLADEDEAAAEAQADFIAENAKAAMDLITKNAADRHEAAERIDAFVQGFPDLAAAIGVKRATLLPEVGSRYERTGVASPKGYPEPYTMIATVKDILAPFTDPWTKQTFTYGVLFTIDEVHEDGARTSQHNISLADFRKYWMDHPAV